ncbi:MAG: CCA tRNA nucleotidyltransferase [Nanobdellota archaeon]
MADFDPKSVLKRIKPSHDEEQRISDAIARMKELIESKAREENYDVEVVAGGSTAKGTFLRGDFDIDMFVRFRNESEDISQDLEFLLSSISQDEGFVLERIHGSRDYFNFVYNEYFFEIIPVKYIRSIDEAKNVTDMSPLHVFWADKKLSQELKDDIRLAKQFCKACTVYGAESYINGLSGHVLDILTIHYGGFKELLEAASQWGEKEIIDPNKAHDNPLTALNKAKQVSPLIVIDPVDPYRNAAAALSQEKYLLFKKKAKQYHEYPSESFFIIPELDKEKLKKQRKKGEALFIITVKPQVGKKDIVGTKVLKVYEFIKRHLRLHDFKLRHSTWWFDKKESHLVFFIDNTTLSETVLRQGPPINKKIPARRFREVHEEVIEKDDRLYAEVPRQFTTPYDCISHLLNQPYVSERVTDYEIEKHKDNNIKK